MVLLCINVNVFHNTHQEILSFLHRWDCCWKSQFDTDVKTGNYNHHDGQQLLFLKKKCISKHRSKSILIHEYQHKSTRINTSLTRVNTNQSESTLVRHKSKMSQHESDTSQHESTQAEKCPRWVNMSQHKSNTSLTQVNLS